MQKKLLTVAVASALAVPAIAVAQSTTEVYGTVNMAFGQFRYTDGSTTQNSGATTVGASASKWDVANGASNYGVRSRENLGGGLSGWVQIEQNAPLERSSNQAIKPASRNSAVGLQGGFGNFFMGQWTTPWADLDALWGIGTVGFWGPVTSIIGRRETTGTAPNPNCVNADGATPGGTNGGAGTVVCDALEGGGGVGHAFWRRVSNAVFYQSPVMAGVQVKLAYQTNEGKATSNPAVGATQGTNANPWLMSSSVQWAGMGGRARIGAAYDKHADFTAIGTTDTGYSVKGGWNFGVVDVGFAYEAMTYKPLAGDVKAKQYGLALAVPVGPGSIRASYSVAKDLSGTGIGTLTDTGAKQYNIGYEHRFSKRTNIGIGYAKIDNKANAQFTWTGAPPNQSQSAAIPTNTPLFGSDVSTFFISMTHRF
jgi:predicted porin